MLPSRYERPYRYRLPAGIPPMFHRQKLLFALLALGPLAIGVSFQPAAADDTTVQPATYNAADQAQQPAASSPPVTFSSRPARVGDRAAQTVGVELEINTSITQAGKQAHSGKNKMQRRQQRFVEVLEVSDGRVRRAHVTYPLSRISSTENDQPGDEVVQPVEKESYIVTRAGERLTVTDTEGAIPSQAEFEIVVTGLQDLGRVNPLAKYLVGQTISIGDRLELPRQIAEQMMGFGGEFGQVEKFELELKSVTQIDQQPCAIFAASIKAVGEVANPIRIHAYGQVAIQIDTCRTVSAEISGPLTLSVAEHTPEGSFQYKAQGGMRLAVKSQYGHAQQ